MNRLLSTLLFAATVSGAIFFTACDNIEENERYIEMPVQQAKRTVLLEDFTGQGCKNCPEAHDAIHALQEQYGDALIAVSIHPAENKLVYSESKYGTGGLGIEDGKALAAAAQAGNKLPIGQIDRVGGLWEFETWSTAVYEAVKRETSLNISGKALIADSIISVDLKVLPAKDFAGKLNVWVLEDSVVARQLLPNGNKDDNYIHNHLLRKCITPAEGLAVEYEHSIYTDKHLKLPVKSHWNHAHLRVIAFLTAADGRVEQAVNIQPEVK